MAWGSAILAKVDARQGNPVFAFVEATATGVVSSGFGYFTADLESLTGGESTWKPLLEALSSIGQNRDLKSGALTVSQLTVKVSARDNDVLAKVVATEGVPPVEPSHRVSLYFGYPDVTFSDWDRIWTGRIKDARQRDLGVSWDIIAISPRAGQRPGGR